MLDVFEDHFEVLVVEGGSRSAESSCEHHRIRHTWDVEVDVFLINRKVELVRVWWCSITMFERTNFLHCVCLCLIPQVSPFCREHRWRDCLHTSRVSPFNLKNQVLLATVHQQSLVNGTFFLSPQKYVPSPRVSPFDHKLDWVWIALVWKIQHEVLAVVQLQNPIDHSL